MVQETEFYSRFKFPGQRADEKIRLLIRKHWIMDVKIGLTFLVVGLLPLGLAIFLEIWSWNGSVDEVFLTITFSLIIYFMVILLITYIKWLNEELDLIIATDQRIVLHEQLDLFHRQVSEAHISEIQDVSGTQKGILQSILHYGMVEIQTASNEDHFVLKHVDLPYQKARILLDLRDQHLKKHPKLK